MKIISTDKYQQKQAKIPHELFTVNAALVHLFLPVAMLKFSNAHFAITLPILLSIFIIIWTYFRTQKAKKVDCELVKDHWQISLNRYKILIGAYILYAVINIVGYFISSGEIVGMNGESITANIFLIISIIPLFIAVFLSVLLGSGSLYNAGKGEA